MSDGSGPLTQAQALALVQRTTDPGWFTGMQDSPDGQAILNEMTAPLAEASNAVMAQVAACAIATAPAGRPGQCDLHLTRALTTEAVFIPKGFLFVDSRGGQLALREDVTVAVGQADIYLPLVTVRQLDLLNNTEPAFDDLLSPGDGMGSILPTGHPLPFQFLITPTDVNGVLYYDLAQAPLPFWGCVRSDGGDIRVYSTGEVQCAREVSGFNVATHSGSLFFATNSGTAFWVRYGSGEAEPDPADPFGKRAVWETGAILVAHLEDITDSSQYAQPMIDSSSVPAAGKLSAARALDGAAGRYVDTGAFIAGDELTIVYWFKGPTMKSTVRRDPSGGSAYVVAGYNGIGKVQHILGNDVDYANGLYVDGAANNGAIVQDGNWHHCAMVWKRNTANGFKSVFDGVVVDQRNSSNVTIADIPITVELGHNRGPGEFFAGTLDEVRIYLRALSPEELAIDFANQNAPGDFWRTEGGTYGLPENATYVSSTPIVGAEADWLSAHGQERGCYRQPGEDGEAYRLRVRAIPNAATPVAIQNAVHGAQSQADLPTVYMVEPMRDQASDAARAEIDLVFADSLFFDEGFLDDPLGVDLPGKLPWRTCEMPSNREARAYFRLGVAGELLEPDGSVWYWDAGYFDDPAWGFPDAGMHPTLVASLRAIQESARVKVAGGVQFDTYVECVNRIDLAGEGLPTRAFTVSADPGTVWLLREGLVTVTVNGEPVNPALHSYRVDITLADGSVISSGLSRACDGMPLRTFELERIGYRSQPVAQIAVIVQGGGLDPVRAIGTFWVTPMSL